MGLGGLGHWPMRELFFRSPWRHLSGQAQPMGEEESYLLCMSCNEPLTWNSRKHPREPPMPCEGTLGNPRGLPW